MLVILYNREECKAFRNRGRDEVRSREWLEICNEVAVLLFGEKETNDD